MTKIALILAATLFAAPAFAWDGGSSTNSAKDLADVYAFQRSNSQVVDVTTTASIPGAPAVADFALGHFGGASSNR